MRHWLNILMKCVLYFEVFRIEFKHGKFDYFLKEDLSTTKIKILEREKLIFNRFYSQKYILTNN